MPVKTGRTRPEPRRSEVAWLVVGLLLSWPLLRRLAEIAAAFAADVLANGW